MHTFKIGDGDRENYDLLDASSLPGLFRSVGRQSVRYLVTETFYGRSAIQLDPTPTASAFSLHPLSSEHLAVGCHLGPVEIELDEDSWVNRRQSQLGFVVTSRGRVFMRCTGPQRFDVSNLVDLLMTTDDDETWTKNYLHWRLKSKGNVLYNRGATIVYPPRHWRFDRFNNNADNYAVC
jgi:hypothetical protein